MERTRYSEEVPGSKGNYEWAVTFDRSWPGGYLGITQKQDRKVERVLLSKSQANELLRFLRPYNKRMKLTPRKASRKSK